MGKFEYGFILKNNIVSELNVWRVIAAVMVNFMCQLEKGVLDEVNIYIGQLGVK